jgi:hypothetical protein
MAKVKKPRFFSGTRALWFFVVACTSQTEECPTQPLAPGQCAGFYWDGPHDCTALSLSPASGTFGSRIFKGDTLRLSTFSDSGFSSPVTWSVAGTAITLLSDTTYPYSFSGAAAVVRADRAGTDSVTATHQNPLRVATTTLTVFDSSVVELVDFKVFGSIKAGQAYYLTVRLMDGSGVVYKGRPDRWTSSDSSVAVVNLPLSTSPYILTFKAGTATITGWFAAAHNSVQVTVTP